jgi:Lrp/AsnC family leucine-responsive transcriptional regulator
MHENKLLDEIGVQILRALQENARISFSELGRNVGLSSPAVAERVHKLEESGYIKGYRTVVDQGKMGLPLVAFISLKASADKLAEVDEMIGAISEVVEGYHLSGSDDILLKVVVSSMSHLESIINHISSFGETSTSIVLSSPVSSRVLIPLQREQDIA